ncbi:hypothetical protein GCM10029964_061960 [Kibdelosporangium lantanae]
MLASSVIGRLWLIVTVTPIGLAVAVARCARRTCRRNQSDGPHAAGVIGGGLAMLITALVGQLADVGGL